MASVINRIRPVGTLGARLPGRVFLSQVTAEAGGGVVAAFLEDVCDVAAGEDDYGVAVLADFLVGLIIEVRGGDQDAELAVPQPGDEPAGLADSDAVGRGVALGFERELDCYRV